jgi:hypothetical protein
MFLVCHLGIAPESAIHIVLECREDKLRAADAPNEVSASDLIAFLQRSVFLGATSKEIRSKMRRTFLEDSLAYHRTEGGFKDSIPENLEQALSINVPTFVAAWQMKASSILDRELYSLAVAILQVVPNSAQLPPWILHRALTYPYPTIEQLLLIVAGKSKMIPFWIVNESKIYVFLEVHDRPRNTLGSYAPQLPKLKNFTWRYPKQGDISSELKASSLQELGTKVAEVLELQKADRLTPESLIFIDYLVVNGLKQAAFATIEDLIHTEVPEVTQIRYLPRESKWKILMPPTLPPTLDHECFVLDHSKAHVDWNTRRLSLSAPHQYQATLSWLAGP